jgi:hypothetical protein
MPLLLRQLLHLHFISGITAAAVSEVAHGGENNASEFTTTEQLALQGLVGGISAELRGGKFQDANFCTCTHFNFKNIPSRIIQKHHPRSNSPILKTTTPCFGGEPTCNHCNCALAGAKVGAKVRVFGAAKVGVNADIGSANQEWVYGPDGWCSKSYGSQRISAELKGCFAPIISTRWMSSAIRKVSAITHNIKFS